jgi:hypothetical protein
MKRTNATSSAGNHFGCRTEFLKSNVPPAEAEIGVNKLPLSAYAEIASFSATEFGMLGG